MQCGRRKKSSKSRIEQGHVIYYLFRSGCSIISAVIRPDMGIIFWSQAPRRLHPGLWDHHIRVQWVNLHQKRPHIEIPQKWTPLVYTICEGVHTAFHLTAVEVNLSLALVNLPHTGCLTPSVLEFFTPFVRTQNVPTALLWFPIQCQT
jgi:hypothetical protein